MYPSRIALFLLIPIYLGCAAFGAADYALYKQRHVFLTDDRFWLGLAALLAFAIFSFCAEIGVRRKPTELHIESGDLRVILMCLYVVTLLAYAIFLSPIVSNPQLVIDLYRGSITAASTLRDTLERIPGVTTLSTLQSLCIVLHLIYRPTTGRRLPPVYRFLLVALVTACLLRAWLWSERLALLELAIPAAMLTFGYPGKKKRLLWAAGPALGLAVVFSLFSVGEYFRSWQFYRADWNDSFLSFSWARFIGYYATALNNGALMVFVTEPVYEPLYTSVWFYKLPIWALLGIPYPPGDMTKFLLTQYANPEFNNKAGLFMPFLDYGATGGVLCWAILGAVSGFLLKSFGNLRLFGVILFPVWYIGVLEILRLFYWGESRFFPVLVVGCLIALYLGMRASQLQRAQAARLVTP